jgi:hypothetical protein
MHIVYLAFDKQAGFIQLPILLFSVKILSGNDSLYLNPIPPNNKMNPENVKPKMLHNTM